MNDWMNKKVYVETTSGRKYSGVVVEETSKFIVIIDFRKRRVEIPKEGSLIQEEE